MSLTGAAIEEGTLKPGDRLLEVNEVCVDGMTQSEVVTLLRNAPLDSEVKLVVSRHLTTTATAERKAEQSAETMQSPSKKQIQFHIDEAAAANAPPLHPNPNATLDNDEKEVSYHSRNANQSKGAVTEFFFF